ncbi:hypothetical protein [Psychroserpens luteolus]|uniref:hypothetical protein n=1 Tax=Psychroserpens luteolus TaxID=2855840 RepID=UPI001E4E9936|nr:hypothetical protein [Psychroserpens luteolus]MCD2260660.1 hypothetical protein [Psychroserpens luteolus]
MRQFIKTTLFIVVIATVVVFSKQIQNEIIESYNHCVEQLANRSITNANLSSF